LFSGSAVIADDAREAWRSDLDGGDLSAANRPIFLNGLEGKSEPDRLIFLSQESVVTLGGRFGSTSDYAELAWNDLKDLPLLDYPILEMRYRFPKPDSTLYIEVRADYAAASGETRSISLYVHHESEEWRTKAFRLAGDESLPDEWRPQDLVDLSIRVHAERPGEAEIDWLRLRKRNEAEDKREKEWMSMVSGGPPPEPLVLREFFPFGIYDDAPDISRYRVTHRHSFEVMSRNHLNYKQAGFIQKHGHGSLTIGPSMKAAERTGVLMSARLRPVLNHLADDGVEAARAWAKPSVDAIGDSPAVIGYDLGDERPLTDLWMAAPSIRIL
jgi:hypothetical protein